MTMISSQYISSHNLIEIYIMFSFLFLFFSLIFFLFPFTHSYCFVLNHKMSFFFVGFCLVYILFVLYFALIGSFHLR